ncbi:MAG: magnesium transporter, partial [Planctomycetes bacterium]|nr:magnesium transporter [Planctomycetota bacterium]
MTADQDNLHDQLTAALVAGEDQLLRDVLAEARAPDIAESFALLDDEERSRVLFALPPGTAAEVIINVGEAVRSDVVDELDADSIRDIVAELSPDDAADVLGELSAEEAGAILDQMPDEVSLPIERLLGYDESTAGGRMTPDVVAVPASATVADAVEYVRDASHEEDLNDIFIVDSDHKLVGTVPLRRLVTSPRTTRLADIAVRDVVTVLANEDQETVVQVIRKYDVSEVAVIDVDGRLLGRITHDDLLDVAEEEAAEDFLRMGGTDAAELETHSVLNAVRVRLTWLLPCMIGLMATAAVLRLSRPEFDLAIFATLVLFSPLIAATSGNAGIQITTVIVRGFATGERASAKLQRVLIREGRIVLAMAPLCGILAWGLVTLFLPTFSGVSKEASTVVPAHVAMAVGSAMALAIVLAGFLGIALPFSFRWLGVDPAVASGPLVTTLNDAVSVAIYMGLAILIV